MLHHISFLQQSLNFSWDLPKVIMVLQGDFVNLDSVFGYDNPTHNPSPVQELSLLTQCSGFTEAMLGGLA